MKRILVTGGFGFLGSHLIEGLLQDPTCHVHVVDNLSTNPLPLDFLLDELGHPPRLTYTICSVAEYVRSSAPVYDEIYHLASIVGPAGVIPHMGKIVKSIVDDSYDLMGIALQTKARFIDVSTSEIYGGGQEGFCSESMARIVPARSSARLEYAVGKLAAETALLNMCQVTDLNASIVRPFNISGPRQSGKGGFVLPRFIAAALHNQDLTVFGDGQQIRAFTNVIDMVDGICKVAAQGKRGEVYNVGNPANRCAIDELADAVIRVTGSQSRKVYVDPKTIYGPLYVEASNKYPDARKIMSELGWQPRYSRDETIHQTADYMRRLPQAIFDYLAGDPR
jgi:UDP-glucose 4-epimerase